MDRFSGNVMRVLVMIAAHNEEENIAHVVAELEGLSKRGCLCAGPSSAGEKDAEKCGGPYGEVSIDYLIINDGSTDHTEEICREKEFHYVSLPVNLGIGGAIQTGYRYARDHGYDIAVQLDGDGQHDPAYLPDVIRPIAEGRADYVIGSRFVRAAGSGTDSDGGTFSESMSSLSCGGKSSGKIDDSGEGFHSTGARRTGIRFLSGLIHLCCGKRVLDVTSGFRAVGRRSIEVFAENYPMDYPEPEAIIDAVLRGERVLEVPVIMREREHGTSSINLKRSVYYMIKVSLDIIVCRISYGLRRDPSAGRAR